MKQLENTIRKLENQGLLEQYDDIIKEQLVEGIIEPAEEQVVGREFYIPHKLMIRESAESRKLCIVYDASAQAYDKTPSLNDCLQQYTNKSVRTVLGTRTNHSGLNGIQTHDHLLVYYKLTY